MSLWCSSACGVNPGKPLDRLEALAGVGFKAVHAGPVTGAQLEQPEVAADGIKRFIFSGDD